MMISKFLVKSYTHQIEKFQSEDKELINTTYYENDLIKRQLWKTENDKTLLDCYSENKSLYRKFYQFDKEHSLDIFLTDEGYLSEIVYHKYEHYLHLEFDGKGKFLRSSKANLNDRRYKNIT